MTKAEIIASLKDQAKDKDILANGEKDSIFTRDAQALREAAEMLEKSEEVRHGQEPNRVLTLEEVREHCKQGVDAAPLWGEFSGFPSASHWIVVDSPDEVFCTDTVRNFCMSYVDIYKKSWRCWLRKPTQEEMATTPWREK